MVARSKLHNLVLKGHLPLLMELLGLNEGNVDVNLPDEDGFTPLMCAVANPKASIEIVSFLLDHGADVQTETRPVDGAISTNAVALALGGGNPEIVRILMERGGDIHYQRERGYCALIDAVHGRDILHDLRLIDLLNLLIEKGVKLNGITSYGESGLRVLSRIGRFDAVKVLLDAGADYDQLAWTPLMSAVALGSLSDLKREIDQRPAFEERDWWKRTAWLIAIQTGDVAKSRSLYDAGVDTRARGRCDKPPLFYAIENHHSPMLDWLLGIGSNFEDTDEFGVTPLMNAVEYDNLPAVERLLKGGARLNREKNGQTALSLARTRGITKCLLDAGADPGHLSFEAKRTLLGFDAEPSTIHFDASPNDFRDQRRRWFGISNPQKFEGKYYTEMVRAGISAYQAKEFFRETVDAEHPVWCAQRFGQSICSLPDGRIIQIGGEHEDFYDPDFCIYNDVFVHHSDGTIEFFGYPEETFPPIDFHTATVLTGFIWIIGCLGYSGKRRYGETPVYRLDLTSYQMEKMRIAGESPGWIYRHTAAALPGGIIQLSGGEIATFADKKETHVKNSRSFLLDTERCVWSNDCQ